MIYGIKAYPTKYADVVFRSRLEARWAAFFDLIGWKWDYECFDLDGWIPDFYVTFPCGHSECGGEHSLLIEIKPYLNIKEFEHHPCMLYPFGISKTGTKLPADAAAAFGNNPTITHWEMEHGSGGGEESLERWAQGDLIKLWKEAGYLTRYEPK